MLIFVMPVSDCSVANQLLCKTFLPANVKISIIMVRKIDLYREVR